jgi:hypothetical protein
MNALRAAGGVSCHHYVSTVHFRDSRARNECLQLGLFIDAYLDMEVDGLGLRLDSDLLDLMCRRLIGVLNADEHGNWSLATASQRSGISRMAGGDLFAQLSRAANAYDRVQKAVNKSGPNGAGTYATGAKKAARRGRRGGGMSKPGNSPNAPPRSGASDAAARSAAPRG